MKFLYLAGLVLAVMILPFVTAISRDVFDTVPVVLKEAAYGVGATTFEVVGNIVIPYTRVGVIGGGMLALGRALGETMAVTFVIGNAYRINPSLFSAGNSIRSWGRLGPATLGATEPRSSSSSCE